MVLFLLAGENIAYSDIGKTRVRNEEASCLHSVLKEDTRKMSLRLSVGMACIVEHETRKRAALREAALRGG